MFKNTLDKMQLKLRHNHLVNTVFTLPKIELKTREIPLQ